MKKRESPCRSCDNTSSREECCETCEELKKYQEEELESKICAAARILTRQSCYIITGNFGRHGSGGSLIKQPSEEKK